MIVICRRKEIFGRTSVLVRPVRRNIRLRPNIVRGMFGASLTHLLLWTGLVSWSGGNPVIVRRPQNVVREVGRSVQLECSINDTSQGPFTWRRYQSPLLSVSGSQLIYYSANNAALQFGTDIPTDRFRRSGQYGLSITSLTVLDGATYGCEFIFESLSASANVFVIGKL